MLQTDRNTKLIDHQKHETLAVNAWDTNFRRELLAKVNEEQGKALRSAMVAAGRLVRRVIWVMVDFWNIPVLGAGDARRFCWAPRDRLYDRPRQPHF